jgi:hypothetical protein
MGSKIVKAGTSSGMISPVSQLQQNQQVRPLGLLYNSDGSYPTDMPKLGGTLSQVSKPIKNSVKFNQILQAVQKKRMARGGRVGYANGSQPQITQQQIAMIVTMLKKGADMSTISSMVGIPEQQIQMIVDKIQQGIQQKAKGGITEIDYRDEGGFVPPIGKKEREDDIPAMLSNNEFVFTADAVRNAGGGSVKEGAKKMYALMKKLEGK